MVLPDTNNAFTHASHDTGPPKLPYNLTDKKQSITISWAIIIFGFCLLPVALFYTLWFGTSLSPANVFTIVTTSAGVTEIPHICQRLYLLIRKDPFSRPLGSQRGWLDSFQFTYFAGFWIVALELVVGTAYAEPLVRLCSMPVPSIMLLAASIEICCTFCCLLHFKLPFRISSLARGETFRPGIYFLIEDIVAVDGHGGRPYRMALDSRYRASPNFRLMLVKMSFFWSGPALLVVATVTAVVFNTPNVVAFGVGWCVPFLWAAFWAWASVVWLRRMLRDEKIAWNNESS